MSLLEVFKSFCAFGDKTKGAVPMLDGSKFAKMFRDFKLLDKNVTATDVDIVFSKVKSKTERKITFKQFEEALKMLAAKKFPGADDAYDQLKAKFIEGKGPAVVGATKAVKSAAVDRLTDTTKYTGSHKERFDDGGKGRGVAGRKEVYDHAGYVQGYKEKDTFDKKVSD